MAIGALGFGAVADAQTGIPNSLSDAARQQSVGARARPDYEPVGIAAGGFRLYPSVPVQLTYDDNVFNSDVQRVGDASARLSPRAVARSNWARHALVMTAGGQFERFAKRKSENNDQYDAGADGIVDLTGALVALGASYARRVEPRGTLGDIFAAGDRIRYNLASGRATGTLLLGNASVSAGATVSRFGYLPVGIGAQRVSQDYRDRWEATGTVRADYRVGPGLRLFVSGTYNDQRYRQRVNGFDQNSHGYALLGGASFALTELISGEVGIGYLDQSYVEPTFRNIGGVAYNGRFTWNTTPLMTLALNGARTIQQSPFVDQTGILQDNVQATLDYEMLRHLVLTAQGAITVNRYRGIDRRDRLHVGELRARYLLNRSCEAGLVLSHRRQSASGLFGRRYSGSSVSLSLTVKR